MQCQSCGSPLTPGTRFCSVCGNEVTQQETMQPTNPQAYPQTNYSQPEELKPEMPMKWYKFVIYFQLFASAVLNLINAINAFTGGQYGGEAESIYALVDGLKGLDIMYAIALLAIAVMAVYTRSRLKNFCKNGPKLYHIYLVAQIACSIIYVIGANMVIANSVLGPYYEPEYSSLIGNLVGLGIMLACNVTYFKKREHLFVND